MSIVHLSREQVLDGARLPVVVNAATTTSPTSRMAVHCTKLMYISKGSSRLTHAAGVTEVTAGDVVAIPDGYWCAGAPERSVETLTVYADTEFMMQQALWVPPIQQLLVSLRLLDSPTTTLRVLKFAPARMRSIETLLHALRALQRSAEQDFASMARLADVFGALSIADTGTAGSVVERAATRDRHLDRAVFLLHEQLDRHWTIADLAGAVAVSPSQLTRVFRDGLGTTPAQHLRRIRAETMACLLETTDLGVSEAARQVGWHDLSHASRAFKRHHGVAPSRYVHNRLTD